jgi:hypothetical protein
MGSGVETVVEGSRGEKQWRLECPRPCRYENSFRASAITCNVYPKLFEKRLPTPRIA